MTQTPAADIVERAKRAVFHCLLPMHPYYTECEMQLILEREDEEDLRLKPSAAVSLLVTEIEAFRVRDDKLQKEVDAMREKAVSNARERNALQCNLDEAVKAMERLRGWAPPSGDERIDADLKFADDFLASIRGETDCA